MGNDTDYGCTLALQEMFKGQPIPENVRLWPHQQEVIDAIKACELVKDGGEPVYGIDTSDWKTVQKSKRSRWVGTKPDTELE